MKTIPAALLTHKAGESTTMCFLAKSVCRDGDIYGLTTLDEDVVYDDGYGDGPVTYKSINGYYGTTIESKSGTGVDNAEFGFITAALEAQGLTEAQLRAGKLDFGDLMIYQVNYNDLTTGRHEYVHRGKWGELSTQAERAQGEFRSLMQLLKQGITQLASLTCRAPYGSQVGEVKFPCTKVRTWVSATITAVDGAEADRKFTCSGLAQAAGYFVPGVVRILTGANAGFEMEVTDFTAGAIELSLPAWGDFANGDTLEISQDCTKLFDDATHGCLYHHGADRVLWFRGEPLIPIGREGELSMPGAGL